MDYGAFKSIMPGLEVRPWPDVQEFRVNYQRGFRGHLLATADPKMWREEIEARLIWWFNAEPVPVFDNGEVAIYRRRD